jgi:NADPH:quinone reductase-like Zn-dependent oxidoreductase
MAFLYSLRYPRRTITATASTMDKLDWLLSLPAGATHAANYKKENFVEVTNAATGGKGVDLIVDMVGQAHFSRNLDALATDGRMTMLSLISGSPTFHMRIPFSMVLTCKTRTLGSEVASLDLRPILMKRLCIQGSTLRSRSTEYKAEVFRRSVTLSCLHLVVSSIHMVV